MTDSTPFPNSAAAAATLRLWQPVLAGIAAAAAAQDSDGAHDSAHLQRVWHNAAALLADHPGADALVVMAACYLHDLVNLPKNHPERHLASRQSAAQACAALAQRGFPAEKLAGVGHAIACHSFSADLAAHSLEAQIVQDADRLDALGAVGLARLFYVAGSMGAALADADDPLATRRPLDDKRYALDHITSKLATLPGRMHTAAGRALGWQRLRVLTDFRDQFLAESGGATTPPDHAHG